MNKFLIPLVAMGALAFSAAAFAGCIDDPEWATTSEPVTTADTDTTPITIPTKPSS